MTASMNNINVSDAYRKVISTLNGEGFTHIASVLFEVFQSPVVILDSDFHLLSMYADADLDDKHWRNLRKNKIISMDTLFKLKQVHFEKLSENFYRYKGGHQDLKYPYILGIIRDTDQVYGHICTFFGRTHVTPDELSLANALYEILVFKFKYSMRINKMEKHMLLKPMLDLNTSQQSKDALNQQLIKFTSRYHVVLAAYVGNKSSEEAFARALMNDMSHIINEQLITYFKGHIVILITGVNPQESLREQSVIKKLQEFFSPLNIQFGISATFQETRNIFMYYRQAVLTGRIAFYKNCKRIVNLYEDFEPLQYFMSLKLNKDNIILPIPALNLLITYDNDNGTHYYDTLREYTLTFHQSDLASRNLCIHRNTLFYRLNRIRDLFDLDFNNPSISIKLLVSFMMLEVVSPQIEKENLNRD